MKIFEIYNTFIFLYEQFGWTITHMLRSNQSGLCLKSEIVCCFNKTS